MYHTVLILEIPEGDEGRRRTKRRESLRCGATPLVGLGLKREERDRERQRERAVRRRTMDSNSSMTNLNGALNGNSKMAMNNLAEKSFTSRHSIIPLYLPNIVGYLRIACTTVSIASGKVLSSFSPRPALLFFSLFVSSLTSRTNPRPRPYAFSLFLFVSSSSSFSSVLSPR